MKSATIFRTLAAPALVLASLLLAGCGSLPPLKHVVLSPPQTQRPASRPSAWKVRRVQMPEYLDNYDIQLRTHDYVVTHLPDAKWAERLPAAITHLLQQTIDEKLETHRDRHYAVHVDVDTFEPQPSGQVVLAARWRVTDAADNTVARDSSLIKKPLATSQRHADAVGHAMSMAVRGLAMQIIARAS